MTNKQILVVVAYLLIFGGAGFAFGHSVGTNQQSKINNQLRVEYDELRNNYDGLEINNDTLITELKWQLESCHQELGDLQDRMEQAKN